LEGFGGDGIENRLRHISITCIQRIGHGVTANARGHGRMHRGELTADLSGVRQPWPYTFDWCRIT